MSAAFFVGSGYIGGTILTTFLAKRAFDSYTTVYVLARDLKKAPLLEAVSPRIKVVQGELSSFDVLKETTLKSDLIIHTATADDLASVQAIIAGLEARQSDRPAAIYVHTSGTGVLMDGGESLEAAARVYSDSTPEDMDSLPDSAPHRNVELFIKAAAIDEKRFAGKAKVAIIAPPLIFGLGRGPLNRASIQLPGWIRDAIKKEKVQVIGKGAAVWNNIHVLTVTSAYLYIIAHLAAQPAQPSNLYWFAETSEHSWGALGEALHASLTRRGVIATELEYITLAEARATKSRALGTNSRSSADRLRSLGWKGDAEVEEKLPTLFESIDEEVEEILRAARDA